MQTRHQATVPTVFWSVCMNRFCVCNIFGLMCAVNAARLDKMFWFSVDACLVRAKRLGTVPIHSLIRVTCTPLEIYPYNGHQYETFIEPTINPNKSQFSLHWLCRTTDEFHAFPHTHTHNVVHLADKNVPVILPDWQMIAADLLMDPLGRKAGATTKRPQHSIGDRSVHIWRRATGSGQRTPKQSQPTRCDI